MGTSACTMTSSTQPRPVPGIWGPYYSAMVPGLWLNEGGQSAAGAAIDQLLRHHPAYQEAVSLAQRNGRPLTGWLADRATRMGGAAKVPQLVGQLHVVPEFLGNRSPFADPQARALVAGLGMDNSIEALQALYLAGLVSLGYGVRQILAAQAAAGLKIKSIVVSGGAARLPIVRSLLADATGIPVVAGVAEEPVLLGAAMLGAIASGAVADAIQAMDKMSAAGPAYEPSQGSSAWHLKRFAAFEELQLAGRRLQD